jgi:hypothetical protein
MSIQLLGAFHCISELCAAGAKKTQELFNATCNYLNGTSSEWYFFADKDPLPAVFYRITNLASHERIQWTYNKYQNTLVQNCQGLQPPALRCNWLSTELHVGSRVYSLDEWIRSLYIVVENYDLLTIETLVNAWSIHERIWPSTYELHIIDDDGEFHVFHMDALLDEEWQSLLPRQPKVSEPYVEEEEEEEEAEEEAPVSSVSSVSSVTLVESVVTPVDPVLPTESTSLLPPSPTPEADAGTTE